VGTLYQLFDINLFFYIVPLFIKRNILICIYIVNANANGIVMNDNAT